MLCFTLIRSGFIEKTSSLQNEIVTDLINEEQNINFSACDESNKVTCVLSGNRFRIGGVNFILSEIFTPNDREFYFSCKVNSKTADLATRRLIYLLSSSPFIIKRSYSTSILPDGIPVTVRRNGERIEAIMMRDGLALPVTGILRPSCNNR
jgi:hypothetical protein